MNKKVKNLPMVKLLAEVLDDLLDHDLANRDHEGEFVRCYTYGYTHKGKHKIPKVIRKAKAVLKRYNKLKD